MTQIDKLIFLTIYLVRYDLFASYLSKKKKKNKSLILIITYIGNPEGLF